MLGWIITVIPSLACGLVAWQLVMVAADWLGGWERISLNAFGFDYSLDLVDLLHLHDLLTILQRLETQAVPLLITLLVVAAFGGGVLIGLLLILLGWGYNLLAWVSGGVAVELQEIPGPDIGGQPPSFRDTM